MTLPGPGEVAPEFALTCDDGSLFSLSEARGQYVILFFYPKDDTPACTTENCDFSDLGAKFRKLGVSVLGISPDTTANHKKFRGKYGLKTRLAADPELVACNAYGVWGEKKMAGHTYVGVKRTSFIIAPDGTIAEVVPGARVKGHALKMLERVTELIAQT